MARLQSCCLWTAFSLMSPCRVCICARLCYLSSLLTFKESSCLSIGFNFSMTPDPDREMASLSSVPFFFALPESVSSHAIPLESPPRRGRDRVESELCLLLVDRLQFPVSHNHLVRHGSLGALLHGPYKAANPRSVCSRSRIL